MGLIQQQKTRQFRVLLQNAVAQDMKQAQSAWHEKQCNSLHMQMTLNVTCTDRGLSPRGLFTPFCGPGSKAPVALSFSFQFSYLLWTLPYTVHPTSIENLPGIFYVFLIKFIYLFVVSVGEGLHMSWHTCGGQRTTLRISFLLPPYAFWGSKCRSFAYVANALQKGPSLQPLLVF